MAKSKRSIDRRKKINKKRKIDSEGRCEQVVYSEPRKILKEKYLSPKGKRLFANAKTKDEKEFVWNRYGKNRYIKNKNAKPIKTIKHYIEE